MLHRQCCGEVGRREGEAGGTERGRGGVGSFLSSFLIKYDLVTTVFPWPKDFFQQNSKGWVQRKRYGTHSTRNFTLEELLFWPLFHRPVN